jgi:glycosyltransferase involved in cell wall biosynthesis
MEGVHIPEAKKMVTLRILILNWRDIKNPAAGGAELAVDNIARGLAKAGHSITIFASAYKGCKEREDAGYATIIRKGSANMVYLNAYLYYRKHRGKFDAVIESVNTVPFFTPLYIKDKKIIVISHQVTGKRIFNEVPFATALMSHTAENLIPTIYKNAEFVVPSKSTKKELIDFGIRPEQITPCYFNMVSKTFKVPKARKYDKPTLITVTRLVKYKRVDMLLEIFSDIRKEKKIDARMIVVGSGSEMRNLKDKAEELGIGDSVKFTGHVKETEKADLLARSWVFVTASAIEGFGISALEAERCGTPVVAFGIGGLKEAVKDNYSGLIVKEGNKQAFEAAVILVLSNRSIRNKLSINSIRYSNSFNTEKEIYKIEKILKG